MVESSLGCYRHCQSLQIDDKHHDDNKTSNSFRKISYDVVNSLTEWNKTHDLWFLRLQHTQMTYKTTYK